MKTKTNSMVEVFKTNVEVPDAPRLLNLLLQRMPQYKINFDLEDCDRILRVEGNHVLPERIIAVLGSNGYQCNVLD